MKNLVWAVGGLIVIILGIFVFFSNKSDENDTIITSPEIIVFPTPKIMIDEGTKSSNQQPFPVLSKDEIAGKIVKLDTDKGVIKFELYNDSPLASSNFINLVNNKFYDGLTFHRREEGFVIQGGDPEGDGTGGPGYKFADEAVTKDYLRGIVAMANSGPNTNGSQFFIMLGDASSLPKQYTIFGNVTEGLDIVDQIAVGDVINTATLE